MLVPNLVIDKIKIPIKLKAIHPKSIKLMIQCLESMNLVSYKVQETKNSHLQIKIMPVLNLTLIENL